MLISGPHTAILQHRVVPLSTFTLVVISKHLPGILGLSLCCALFNVQNKNGDSEASSPQEKGDPTRGQGQRRTGVSNVLDVEATEGRCS